MDRILIIKPSAIGDIVHSLPILPLLRRKWPQAQITWMVGPACVDLVRRHPLIDQIMVFRRTPLPKDRPAQATNGNGDHSPAWWSRDLRRRRFDMVIDLQGLLRSAYFTWRTGAPLRVGPADAREFAWLLYNRRVHSGLRDQHAVERNLTIAEAIGLGRGPVEFPFAVDDADRAFIADLIPPGIRYAALIPGTNWATKRWPSEHFAELVEPLRRRFGLKSVLCGGPQDAALASQIPVDRNLVGQTSLRQTVALLERADLVVANDSGPMHIAAALGRPLVCLYGPTDPHLTGPWNREDAVLRLDIPCSPCFSRKCSHQSCLRWITAEPVLRLAELQLRRLEGGRR
jgi:lipopolysaccharide heptosyltransferase I